jgi:predicted AlkP superfamily pyrophosphatase or phosphodiesterase
LTAKPDYAFGGGVEGPIVQTMMQTRGQHGYLNTDPDMDALFIASGAQIRSGVDLGSITNLRVAPTVAALLGVSLPAATEAPLSEAFKY